ncbi:SDR family oxidoreductase [Granulosicoccus antarcticus]|nr:SDR family oxidoreductase [Granulosicoccus antarcticus]
MHTLVLGAGFSGQSIAIKAAEFGSVCGTRRSPEGLDELGAMGVPGCLVDSSASDMLLEQLARVTHLVVCVAPARQQPLQDPMLDLLRPWVDALSQGGKQTPLRSLEWIGYLSTIGVYGDHGGHWVTEDTPCTSMQPRSLARRDAEQAWQALGGELSVPVSVLRLSGIYGPGRNAVKDAMAGRARMLIKPDQVFNRIHVQDLATATMKAASTGFDGILNITDDEPAPPQDVIRYAHRLIGKSDSEPEAQDFATADITPMARSFYSENKRVSNERSKKVLDMEYRYPTYKQGLDSIVEL